MGLIARFWSRFSIRRQQAAEAVDQDYHQKEEIP